ncbi:uncharacterized protein LOC134531043 [Bacillus rossius redtenbacheri]|uniref:uncharacterized protein LOC134529273 n=1 Tax=Bacillus rossius redtenbacheri TaxID=93214 RepID=UPI002FDD5BBB
MEAAISAVLLEEDADDDLLLSCFLEDDSDIFRRREDEGCYSVLILRHLIDNETKFREYFRVSTEIFDTILGFVKEDITRLQCNRVKRPISAEQKLCLTLRFMATGESFRSLAFQFRICPSWVSIIIKETLQSICSKMLNSSIPSPDQDVLKRSSIGFHRKWNYPNCCGSIDGKHIRIIKPKHSGSLFYNYKDYFSVVLLALVDDNYKFLAIDVGSYGKEGDAGIFAKSVLGQRLSEGTFRFPEPAILPGTDTLMPHVILGDEAFQLTSSVMRPYPRAQSKCDEEKAIYNYRHCRARRTCENAFGILCQYFRVFFTAIAIKPDTVDLLVIASCIIHNHLRSARIPCPGEEEDRNVCLPTENMIPMARQGRNSTHLAYSIRDKFKNYFCSQEGQVSWQLYHVRKTS